MWVGVTACMCTCVSGGVREGLLLRAGTHGQRRSHGLLQGPRVAAGNLALFLLGVRSTPVAVVVRGTSRRGASPYPHAVHTCTAPPGTHGAALSIGCCVGTTSDLPHSPSASSPCSGSWILKILKASGFLGCSLHTRLGLWLLQGPFRPHALARCLDSPLSLPFSCEIHPDLTWMDCTAEIPSGCSTIIFLACHHGSSLRSGSCSSTSRIWALFCAPDTTHHSTAWPAGTQAGG